MELPITFEQNMRTLLKDDYDSYAACLDQPMHHGIRINTMKISVEEFLKINPFHLRPVPWCENGLYYDETLDKPSKHPYYFAGLYYIQEPSAMTPAHVLPVEAGDRVLDICAAPGGKSTELAAKLHGTGLLVSNDISASRAKALLKNLEVFGAENALIISEAPYKLAERFHEYFDKILIDAPCSGEGMFRKSVSMITAWLFVADTVGFLIERVVLRLGDRNLLGSAANVDEIGLLIVVVLHNESPPSAFAEMESSRHAKPDHRREGIPKDYSISAAPHFR